MKAAVCRAYGSPRSLTIEDVPTPVPGPGQVRVRVVASSVNFPDALLVAGRYQIQVPPPFVPGSDFSGTVEEVGEGVEHLSPGMPVYGTVFLGAHAESLVTEAAGLQALPDGIDFRTAAAFSTTYTTAFDVVRTTAALERGQTLVVLGAAGGVGSAAVEIGKHLGARVIACVSTDPKLAIARTLGADDGVVYGVEDLKTRLKELTGGGADAVIDPVGGSLAEEALRATRYGGRFVVVGFASGTIPRIPLNLVLLKGVVVKGYSIASFSAHEAEAAAENRRELTDLLGAGRLRPHIGACFGLDRAADALALVAARRSLGKVIIEP